MSFFVVIVPSCIYRCFLGSCHFQYHVRLILVAVAQLVMDVILVAEARLVMVAVLLALDIHVDIAMDVNFVLGAALESALWVSLISSLSAYYVANRGAWPPKCSAPSAGSSASTCAPGGKVDNMKSRNSALSSSSANTMFGS